MDTDLFESCRTNVLGALASLHEGGKLVVYLVGGQMIEVEGDPGQEESERFWFDVIIKGNTTAAIRFDQVAAVKYTPTRAPMAIA